MLPQIVSGLTVPVNCNFMVTSHKFYKVTVPPSIVHHHHHGLISCRVITDNHHHPQLHHQCYHFNHSCHRHFCRHHCQSSSIYHWHHITTLTPSMPPNNTTSNTTKQPPIHALPPLFQHLSTCQEDAAVSKRPCLATLMFPWYPEERPSVVDPFQAQNLSTVDQVLKPRSKQQPLVALDLKSVAKVKHHLISLTKHLRMCERLT